MKKILIEIIFIVIIISSSAFAAAPVIFFSDLTDGPRTGWNGSATKGAAVTIWGENFGSIRSSNYITVGGINLAAETDYAEWGATANNARGMERITFYLNSSCSTGAQTISVTVGGVTSNTLAFYVRTTGNIRFVDHANGLNSNNGQTDVTAWQTIPYARQHINSGGIIYIRNGTYTELDSDSARQQNLTLTDALSGTANNCTAFIGYPGEFPVLQAGLHGNMGNMNGTGNYVYSHHYTFAKLKCIGRIVGASYYPPIIGVCMDSVAQADHNAYCRVIGIEIDGESAFTASTWTGALDAYDLSYFWIYGCNVHHWGYDKYDHATYIGSGAASTLKMQYIYIGWNEVHDMRTHAGAESGPSGIYIHPRDTDTFQVHADEVYINDNLVYNLDSYGIFLNSRIEDCYIYNNIVYGCGTPGNRGAVQFNTTNTTLSNFRFFNNTIYANSGISTIQFIGWQGAYSPNVAMKNNIIYSEGISYYGDGNYSGTRSSDYDFWYGNGAAPLWATNALSSNPQFSNAAVYDFHLQAASPAIDAGTSAVNTIVTKDYDGISRPQGARYDIGAYENDSGQSGPLIGDVNSDNQVNVQDVQACVNHILGTQDWGVKTDVNGDGSVNILDAQRIANIILGE